MDAPEPPSKAELAVLVSGITSMGLEILAGRIVAPVFGSSIFTWGGIIGVFLTGLSLGYWRGGRRASEHADGRALARLLFGSALLVAVVTLFGEPVVGWAGSLDVPPQYTRFSSLLPITLLFGPPSYLLGVISPYAAELSRKTGVGEASGHVYALGTVGSIAGAFGTTFVLIPAVSVDAIGALFGAMLLVAALAVTDSVSNGAVARGLFVALLLGTALTIPFDGSNSGATVYEGQSAYQDIQVVDDDGVRTLYLDGHPQSAMALGRRDTTNVFAYTRYFHLPWLVRDDVDRVLFVGGGGFTGPKDIVETYPNATVDVIELDPRVVRVATEYFDVAESDRLQIYTGDGRRFLADTDRQYDAIVLDAYRKDKMPFHMTTAEFFDLTERRLTDDGMLVANLISAPNGSGSEFYRAEVKTMRTAYPNVYSFPTADRPGVQNVMLFGTTREAVVTRADLVARSANRTPLRPADVASYRRTVPTDDVPVLRDDSAPVDRLIEPMIDRRYVVNRTDWRGNATA